MFSLFGFLPFSDNPLVEAKGRALSEAGSPAAVDVEIEAEWLFVLIGTVTCVTVRGRGAEAGPSRSVTTGATRLAGAGGGVGGVAPSGLPVGAVTEPAAATRLGANVIEELVLEMGSGAACRESLPVLGERRGRTVVVEPSSGDSVTGTLSGVVDALLLLDLPDGTQVSLHCIGLRSVVVPRPKAP
jgi:hypothetical protein